MSFSVKVTWLNQGGFLFETSAGRVIIDAYLSDIVERQEGLTKLVDPPLALEELQPDYWLCTHDHKDHFDPPTVAAAIGKFSGCKFIGPQSVQSHLAELGLAENRIIPLDVAKSVLLGELNLSATPAIHSDPDAIGVLLEDEGLRIYLSGDTEFFDSPDEFAVAIGEVDVMLICINGKWGNMNSEQAVEKVKIIRPRLAVPMHYGLFAENTVSPDSFVAGCEAVGINTKTFQSGHRYQIEEFLK